MQKAQKGDTVNVHYTGKLDDGKIFDSSVGKQPLSFTVGAGQVIPGFDTAVEGMQVGEKKTVNIPKDKAYGDRNDQMILEAPRAELPKDVNPQIGEQLQMSNDRNQTLIVTVVDKTDSHLVLDANHPLAGKDLIFEIELVEVS